MTNNHRPHRDRTKPQQRREAPYAIAAYYSNRTSKPIDDPPESAERLSSGENRCSRNHVGQGKIPSHIKKQIAFDDDQEMDDTTDDDQDYGSQDTDSISVTVTTVSFTSDESYYFAGEFIGDSNNQGSTVTTLADDKESAASYEIENTAAFDNSLCSPNKDVPITPEQLKQPVDQKLQQSVKRIVEQLLQEQTIAMEAWDEVATEYHRRIEPFTSLFVPHLLGPNLVSPSHNDEYHYLSGKSMLDCSSGICIAPSS